MLDVKNNYRNKHRTITCRACNEEPETQEHALEECHQLHKEDGSKVTKDQVFSNDIELLREISQKVINIIETLKKDEETETENLASERNRRAQEKRATGKPPASINIQMKRGVIMKRSSIWGPTTERHPTSINIRLRRVKTEDEYTYSIV